MSPLRAFTVKVLQYDFFLDGEGDYKPTAREEKYLFSPFVVMTNDEEDAINQVTERTDWLIKEAIFI